MSVRPVVGCWAHSDIVVKMETIVQRISGLWLHRRLWRDWGINIALATKYPVMQSMRRAPGAPQFLSYEICFASSQLEAVRAIKLTTGYRESQRQRKRKGILTF